MNSGEMFRFTPDLGIHRGIIDAAGSVLISENILRKAISNFDDIAMRDELEVALGVSWDLELEPYRGVDLQEVQRLHAI